MKLHSSDGVSVENTLHHALGPFLIISQFFGAFPISGAWPTTNVTQLSFRWCTPAVLISLVLIGFSGIDVFLLTKVVIEHGLKLYTAAPLTFSISCFGAFIAFLRLSYNWPHLMREMRYCEIAFLQPAYATAASRSLSRRIRILGWSLIFFAVIEHLNYIASGVYNNYQQIKQCNLTVDFWQNYFMREHMQYFGGMKYNVWFVPLVEWISISMTFTWNFVDIFLILICHSLAIRFKQMEYQIERHSRKRMPFDFWFQVRTDYLCLVDLFRKFDNKLSDLVLLSCAQNLYFICVQIFDSFIGRDNFMTEFYFWFTLIFVLTRMLIMMFTAASIHDTTNRIATTVYEIPSAFWCLELKRLNEVIVSDVIALSGKGFFFLTRRLIFAMASTIVKYELVLIARLRDMKSIADFCQNGQLQ